MSVRLVCGNCGTIETWESWESAAAAGWDTLAVFGYNACPACPGVSVYLPMIYAQLARAEADPEKAKALLEKAARLTLGPEEGGLWPRFRRDDLGRRLKEEQ